MEEIAAASHGALTWRGDNNGDQIVPTVKWIGRTFGTLGLLLFSAQAGAQTSGDAGGAEPTPQPEPEKAKIVIAVPEATAPVQRSFHMHDGFYARVSPGIGWVNTSWTAKGQPDMDADGTSLSIDVLLGGSPTRGVALGGALLTHLGLATDVTVDGHEVSSEDLDLFMVGPFIDGFPTASDGWHFGGTVGLARSHLGDLKNWGLGGAAWGGYDAWVGDEWSVGGLARLMLARTTQESGDDLDASATGMTFTLAFTALYH